MMLEEVRAARALYWTARTQAHVFAGVFDLSEIAHSQADLGFMVPRALWGEGYGWEAAAALIHHARKLKLDRLAARIHTGNTASNALLRKLGFTPTEALPALEIRPGVFVDCQRYGLTL
jgi:RimJ/RimL family protein N-acetyltransferase